MQCSPGTSTTHGTRVDNETSRAPHTFRIFRMIRNFTLIVQRPDRPDYRLAPVGQYGQVEVIFRLQRSLVRDNRVSVDNCRVQQTNAFAGRTLEVNSLIIVRRLNVSSRLG